MKILIKQLNDQGMRLLVYLTTENNKNIKARLTSPGKLDNTIDELSKGYTITDIVMLD